MGDGTTITLDDASVEAIARRVHELLTEERPARVRGIWWSTPSRSPDDWDARAPGFTRTPTASARSGWGTARGRGSCSTSQEVEARLREGMRARATDEPGRLPPVGRRVGRGSCRRPSCCRSGRHVRGRGAPMGRSPGGQVLRRETTKGVTWALRFQAYGSRRYLTLGPELDGWNRRLAEEELRGSPDRRPAWGLDPADTLGRDSRCGDGNRWSRLPSLRLRLGRAPRGRARRANGRVLPLGPASSPPSLLRLLAADGDRCGGGRRISPLQGRPG